ncbi:unnamed protein product [Boreogadus saida]
MALEYKVRVAYSDLHPSTDGSSTSAGTSPGLQHLCWDQSRALGPLLGPVPLFWDQSPSAGTSPPLIRVGFTLFKCSKL